MKILFFGNYHRDYARNQVVKHGLEKNNVLVEELHSSAGFLARFFALFFKALSTEFDVLWVPYPGHLDVFTAKLVCLLKRKPLVFDVFVSRWDSELEYGNISGKSSLKAKWLWWTDKLACQLADLCVIDTEQHINFFVKEFSLSRKKFKQFPIGANERIFFPKKQKKHSGFRVLYYGLTAPLHGIEYILEAAFSLKNEKGIEFVFVGDNWRYRQARKKYSAEKSMKFKGFLSLKKIAFEISEADLVLGIFGDTPKANRVIPNKVFEGLAMQKPVVTMSSDAGKKYLKHKQNIFLVKPASGKEIAGAVLELRKNNALRKKIALEGRKIFEKEFSEEKIGALLKKELNILL